MTNLPPQAYTKEVLANAYEWLKGQPPSIKELAQSADNLVSLYLQSRRHKDHSTSSTPHSPSLESSAPVSTQSFKSDLKSLAEGLRQFDEPEEKKQPPPRGSFQEPSPPISSPKPNLDALSLQKINQVQSSLNLSSETEVIRMLISLGYDRIKNILP